MVATKGYVDAQVGTVSAAGSSGISPTCYYTTSTCDSSAKLLDGVYTAGGSSNVNHNICCFMGGGVSALYSGCSNDDIGTTCTGNVKNLGIFNGSRYMVTPGGCTDSTTPTCAGGSDSLTKTWGTYGTTTGINSVDGKMNTLMLSTYSDAYAAQYCQNMTYG